MRFLVLQHIDCEHPGALRDHLARDGIVWDSVELDAGEAIPDLETYDALWVMGGPMDVWQEDAHPWLKAEKAVIRHAVAERRMPFLGLCLGHQLLAEALGGRVGPSQQPEIGVMKVELTEAGRASPFLAGLGPREVCLQWHSAEVVDPPPGATVLAASPACAVQAMSIGAYAFSMQYHVEVEPDTVRNWGAVPAYRDALEASAGRGALARFDHDAAARMPDFQPALALVYENWMRTTKLMAPDRPERTPSPAGTTAP